MEPAASLPIPRGEHFVAIIPASPPELPFEKIIEFNFDFIIYNKPPQVLFLFHGFNERPKIALFVSIAPIPIFFQLIIIFFFLKIP